MVVGVDPPASASGTCGIVVAAMLAEGSYAVLADESRGGASPEGWAAAVAGAEGSLSASPKHPLAPLTG